MSEIQKVYKLKKEKKLSFIDKMKLKNKEKNAQKRKIQKSNNTEKDKIKELKALAKQAEKEAAEEAKRLKKEESTKEKEAIRITKEMERQRKLKDKKILEEAKAHQRELEKAYKQELKNENKRLEQLKKDEQNRLKRNEELRKSQQKRFKENKLLKNKLTSGRNDEQHRYERLTNAEKRRMDKIKHQEFLRQEKVKEEAKRADDAIERERRRKAGLTPWIILKNNFRRLLNIYSFKNLQETINSYGYQYSFNEFIITTVLIVVLAVAIAWISKLRNLYLYTIAFVAFASVPLLIYGYFKQLYNMQKFEMVQSYLSNILPIFMQKPKYRYAVEEIHDLSSEHMQKVVSHTIDYIDTNTDDSDVVKTGMSLIEEEFPNSRMKAVHKLMLDIEKGNSENYTDICENMFVDVEGWIRRVYNFQKELKSKRTSLLVLCGMSVLLNTIFTYMYGTSEVFDGFTDKTMYQVCTFIFVLATFIVAALILTKLHGAWLVNDAIDKREDEKIRNYNYIHTHDGTPKSSDIMIGLILVIGGAFWLITGEKMGIILVGFGIFFVNREKLVLNSKRNSIAKALMIEFPNWLRGVALDLNDMTVVVAIEKSMSNCSYMMRKEIEKFFELYNENPTSIQPFSSFLAEYKLEDVQSSMKILYTIQSMSKEETNRQVSMIVQRNQELLAKTEQLQNEESLGMAEMLGYAPMVLLTAQLIMSMILMFAHIMEYMNMITSTIG